MEKKKAQFEIVAETLIDEMKKGTSIFQKSWEDVDLANPYNAKTNNAYKGINFLSLILQGKGDPRWLTFKQAKDEGYKIKKGARGTQITYFSLYKEQNKKDENGKFILDAEGEKIKEKIKLDKPLISTAYVFNAESIEGIPPLEITKKQATWEDLQEIEDLVTKLNIDLFNGGNRAFYSPSTDRIVMPHKNQFGEEKGYYSTLLHEIGHWTGHKDRLDRFKGNNKFGSPEYAKEELRAEIASFMLGAKYGVGSNLQNHASYIQSWIKVLQDDPFEIYKASADAQSITDYIEYNSQKNDLTQGKKEIGVYQPDRLNQIVKQLENLNIVLPPLELERIERELFDNKDLIVIDLEIEEVLFEIKITNSNESNFEILVRDQNTGNEQVFRPEQGFDQQKMKDLVLGKEVEAYLTNAQGETKSYNISFDFSLETPKLQVQESNQQEIQEVQEVQESNQQLKMKF